MKKLNLFLVLVFMALATFLTACEPLPQVPVSALPALRNDLAEGKLVLRSALPEGFTLVREYSTSYDAKNWRITDSKSLTMRAWLEGVTKDEVVLVEHVHIDISLKSTYESLDGWPQDTMDDSVHGGTQSGFFISEKYPYENVFAIEGFSKTLIEGWGYFIGWIGQSQIREERLTETSLVRDGKVYANKVQVVYDLLIRSSDEPYFHTRSLIDEFLVPVASKKP